MADNPQDQGADPQGVNPAPQIITEPDDDDTYPSRGNAPEPEVDPAEAVYDAPSQEQAIAEQMASVAAALRPDDESYEPYDPSSRPSPLDPPGDESSDPTDAHRGESFDPRYREEFEGLLFLGSLSKSFSWMHHDFRIKTIGTDEALAISLVIQPWVRSQGEVKAYQAAAVAACLLEVDGKPLPHPLTRDVTPDRLTPRFEWVLRNYQPVVIDMIYGQIMELENKVVEILAAMGKASG